MRKHEKDVCKESSVEVKAVLQSIYSMHKPNNPSRILGKKVKTQQVMVNELSNPSLSMMTC